MPKPILKISCQACGMLTEYGNKKIWEDWEILKLDYRNGYNMGGFHWKMYICRDCKLVAKQVLNEKKILDEIKNGISNGKE